MSELTIAALALLVFYVVIGYKRPVIAFVTAPVAAIILLFAAVTWESIESVVLAPVLFLASLSAVAISAYGRESQEWYHRWAFLILLAFVVALALGAVLLGLHFIGAGAILIVLFILGAVAIIIALISYAVASGRVVAMNVLSTIGSSMRQNLPLPMALDCAAVGRSDATASALRRIKTWLVKGYSLSEAIRRGYRRCPSRALAMLSAGESIGQLPAAIEAVESDMKAQSFERSRLRPVHPFYPLIVLSIAFFITLGMMYFVIPQLKAVLEEMVAGELPWATRTLMEVMRFFAFGEGWIVLLGLLVLMVPVFWLHVVRRRRRPERPYLISRLGDAVKWRLPIVHWFERNRSMVQAVEMLRLSLNAGCPVNEAIRSTLGLDVNLRFRRRLACWLDRVERGEDIAQSARRCGLGRALAWAFDSNAGAGDTPAVLESLESYYRFSYSYRVNLARFILWPLGVVALGLTVGFVVFAIFSPLVMVLNHLTATVYP